MFHSERNQEKYGDTGLEDIQKGFAGRNSLLATHAASPLQTSPDFSLNRTDSALVDSIMALLATFEAADVLPPEDSSQANQLIHGLIQLQSALVKSQNPELKEYLSAAIAHRSESARETFLPSVPQSGLTSKVLDALLIYDRKVPIWDQPGLPSIFQRYNVTPTDWQLIERIFTQAEAAYRTNGSSIHTAYDHWLARVSRTP